MPTLQLHQDYDRREVHDIFEPETPFTPGAGKWGVPGIVAVKDRSGDFVLFVTFGQQQGEHDFDEGISVDGVLRWQSQPGQSLQEKQIRQFIEHDETKNQIYLFLRTAERDRTGPRRYTYLGRLKYLTHDAEREKPVHFAWQLLSWPVPQECLTRMSLSLEGGGELQATEIPRSLGLEAKPVPSRRVSNMGSSTRQFRARLRANTVESDKQKRDLGLAGELAVLAYEKARLLTLGLKALADQVRHVSIIEGDGAGYDILSFKEDGSKLFIEVKTTTGDATSEFFMSSNEVAFSCAHAANYELRRVYNFDELAGSKGETAMTTIRTALRRWLDQLVHPLPPGRPASKVARPVALRIL
jgi:hypothetical protein